MRSRATAQLEECTIVPACSSSSGTFVFCNKSVYILIRRMGILKTILSKHKSFKYLSIQANCSKDDFTGTRLHQCWDIVDHLCYRMTDNTLNVLLVLLLYGDDPFYDDIRRFCDKAKLSYVWKHFAIHRDTAVLCDFMENNCPDPPVLGKRPPTPIPEFVAESGEASTKIGVEEEVSEETDEQQTMKFVDNQDVMILDLSSPADRTRMGEDFQSTNSLAAFLQRPIILNQFAWTPAGNFDNTKNYVDINPWFSYLNDPGIKFKVNNYRMLRADGMRIQFRLNGSPFHYGQLYAGYCPGRYQAAYSGLKEPQNQSVAPTNMGAFNTTTFPLYTHFSQWPGVFINPATNVVQEFDIPFFWPQNYLNTVSSLDFIDMGVLKIWAINALRHSNGATDKITLTVTAHLINPVLTMPTPLSAFTGESGTGEIEKPTKRDKEGASTKPKSKQAASSKNDEYGKGAISAPATALANFAGTLERVPVIGPYALATRLALGKVSAVAKIFGYSRPVNVESECHFNYRSFGPLSLTTAEDTSHKLTLDPKQEVTIDPSVVGLKNVDEMTFAHIFKRESLIVQFPWTIADTQDTNLVQILVNPYNHPANIGVATIDYHTALSWGVSPFLYWRGTLKYRLQIIASQMHRGRLAIVYSPTCSGSATLPHQSQSYQQFIDLAETRDVTIDVVYAHPNPWLSIVAPNTSFVSKGATTFADAIAVTANGLLQVYVLNELTSPTNTSPVTVNVFVSAGDDFMVAMPGATNFDRMTPFSKAISDAYTAESGTADFVSPTESVPVQGRSIRLNGSERESPDVDHQSLVFFGEQAVSLRSLLKRYTFYVLRVPQTGTAGTNKSAIVRYNHPRIPVSRGLCGSANNLANPIFGFIDANGPYNIVRTTLIDWYRHGYVANRGSIRYKYIFLNETTNAAALHTVRCFRDTRLHLASNLFDSTIYPDFLVGTDQAAVMINYDAPVTGGCIPNSFSGAEFEYVRQKNGIEYEHPWYSSQRFDWNIDGNLALEGSPDPNDAYSYQYMVKGRSVICVDQFPLGQDISVLACNAMEQWVAAGEDYSLHYFLGAPIMGYSDPVAPAV